MKIAIVGAKGGVGTTSLTVSLGAMLAQSKTVSILGIDDDQLAATCGYGSVPDGSVEVAPNLWLGAQHPSDYLLRDYGTLRDLDRECENFWFNADRRILCVDNSYGAMRAAIAHAELMSVIQLIVLLDETGRSIGRAEIRDTLGRPVETIARLAPSARCADAGLLATRPTDAVLRACRRIVNRLMIPALYAVPDLAE